MTRIRFIIFLLATAICCNSCKLASVSYAMTGISLSPDVKTFSVDYFPNKALLVVPYLSSLFTERLTNYMRSKTGLTQLTDNNGDIRFEGQITGYYQKPIDIQKDEVAASNRLYIEIRVKFTNTKDDKFDFDSQFSEYADYSTNENFDAVEEELINKILDKIIDDIFNKALVNW